MSIRPLDFLGQGSEPSRSLESGDAEKTKTESVFKGKVGYLTFPSELTSKRSGKEKRRDYAQIVDCSIRENWSYIAATAGELVAIANSQAKESLEERGSPNQWLNQQKKHVEAKIEALIEAVRQMNHLSHSVRSVAKETKELRKVVNAGSRDDLTGTPTVNSVNVDSRDELAGTPTVNSVNAGSRDDFTGTPAGSHDDLALSWKYFMQ